MSVKTVNMNTVKRAAVMTTLAAVAATTAMAAPAQAQGSSAVKAHGTCTSGATWKLKAKHDNTLIQWEFEVDANHAGQVWAVRVTDNGSNAFSGKATTVAPSGSFSVGRKTAEKIGADVVRATATRGSATCSGSVTV
jgi:hypothetical protein